MLIAVVRNQELTEAAHSRLNELLEQANDSNLYGAIGVRVKFECGVAQLVEYTYEGKVKQKTLA